MCLQQQKIFASNRLRERTTLLSVDYLFAADQNSRYENLHVMLNLVSSAGNSKQLLYLETWEGGNAEGW